MYDCVKYLIEIIFQSKSECLLSGYELGNDGNAYKLTNEETNFENARQNCINDGSRLANFENDLELQSVKEMAPQGDNIWIGAWTRHQNGDKQFLWLHDNETIESTDIIDFNFKNNDEYDCAAFEEKPNRFKFKEKECSETYPFLCQKRCSPDNQCTYI